ncbi:MAG: SAM-dependent methyltransferase [Limisphaerales bacterium]
MSGSTSDASEASTEAGPAKRALLAVPVEDGEPFLLAELQRSFPGRRVWVEATGLIAVESTNVSGLIPVPLAFARQVLVGAEEVTSASIRGWARLVFDVVTRDFKEDQPWLLHVVPRYAAGLAGQHRCQLIREALVELLRQRRRHLGRRLAREPEPFSPAHSILQLMLTAPDRGWLSALPGPEPHRWRATLSPFPQGMIGVAVDKAAPCRAFAKLLEAEQRLGSRVGAGATCADLGASPGSWTYVALGRGARVTAVDRSPLRDDLTRHSNLEFVRGDAFSFRPPQPVDWLLCDVIAAPERSVGLLLEWAANRWMRWFVVTLKFKGQTGYECVDELSRRLAPRCREFRLARLCANKNELCVFGELAEEPVRGATSEEDQPTSSPSSTFQ